MKYKNKWYVHMLFDTYYDGVTSNVINESYILHVLLNSMERVT